MSRALIAAGLMAPAALLAFTSSAQAEASGPELFPTPHLTAGTDCSVGSFGELSTTWWRKISVQIPSNLTAGTKLGISAPSHFNVVGFPYLPVQGGPSKVNKPKIIENLPGGGIFDVDAARGRDLTIENGGKRSGHETTNSVPTWSNRYYDIFYIHPNGSRSSIAKVEFNDHMGLGCHASKIDNGPYIGEGNSMQIDWDQGLETCPVGYVCTYSRSADDKTGRGWAFPAGMEVRRMADFEGMNDNMQSWKNNSDTQYCWYKNDGFDGESHEMIPHHTQDLTNEEKDTASSLRPCR
ncbi:peptidase inhibitor family I36 protein [Streptomyces lavendulae]|uniref:peptidase inhibitor family I36 protein n=1 Tax=Streptomyces lavendulae TaxID=1914 RepID=UPI00371C9B4D